MDLATAASPRLRQQHASASEQRIPAPDVLVEATLTLPLGARGVVVLPHASSAARFDRNHRFRAEVLEQAGLGTLQVDLLTPAEEAAPLRNDDPGRVQLLAERLLAALGWLRNQADTRELAIGVFAARQEAAASFRAVERSGHIFAVVAEAGDAELAPREPHYVTGPQLLLLGPAELGRAAELAAEFFGRNLG